jgi:hypothetical protein
MAIGGVITGRIIIAGLIIILSLIFLKGLGWLYRFLLRGAVGISGIFVLDFLLPPIVPAVGINLWTVLVSAVLGLPGVGLMYILVYIWSL